ncbi:MAG TPA: phenolic acid decarboxylase subunit B [Clostridium sp.]|jgi:4-hydroxy-3-polyprenylbenzoate decarboxylase|uniref:Flavin prenyltransferase UbiX n=1 Tax=Clostridium lapidicellarium TaxID=3240931 RepID=A0ABV4E0I5_9CLOT|nr:UbiX family flavin prenyltransferase [uncultured Clostridium sp.]NLU07870.1 UbiX family flavin prenyltransferase [Clostridiales bacterium]HBC95380.1 phenolic acid decarboxylase subunit B [Clostridium sp.]
MEIVVGITGATGVIYGVRLVETLKNIENVKVHLVTSEWAKKNIETETPYNIDYIADLADFNYDYRELGAKISSGSYMTDGMIILPCSMKTLSSIACGYDDNLISRCAGVMLKEGRKLVICPRETPLSPIHIENMMKLSRIGVRILPPMPAFYNNPSTIDDIINYHVMKVLDQFGIRYNNKNRWQGI